MVRDCQQFYLFLLLFFELYLSINYFHKPAYAKLNQYVQVFSNYLIFHTETLYLF